jgi:peptide/nickel transport system permease protein
MSSALPVRRARMLSRGDSATAGDPSEAGGPPDVGRESTRASFLQSWLVRQIAARIALSVLVLLIVSIFAFSIVHLAPGNPIAALTKGHYLSPIAKARLMKQFDLNASYPSQYFHWLGNALQGNFGQSVTLSTSVGSILIARLPVTAELVGGSMLLTLLFGLPIGIIAARRPRSLLARALRGGALTLLSTPAFFLAYLLIFVFVVKLGALPAFGLGSGVGGRFNSLILPCAALALGLVGQIVEVTRVAYADALRSEYVEFARAKGLSEWRVMISHALVNVLPKLLTLIGLQVGGLLAGTVIVEQVFGLAGVGSTLVSGIINSDYALVQGSIMLLATGFIVVNLAADLAVIATDPRARARPVS